jgi:SH3-like domain-containing protein
LASALNFSPKSFIAVGRLKIDVEKKEKDGAESERPLEAWRTGRFAWQECRSSWVPVTTAGARRYVPRDQLWTVYSVHARVLLT